jgi:hypothetical protein
MLTIKVVSSLLASIRDKVLSTVDHPLTVRCGVGGVRCSIRPHSHTDYHVSFALLQRGPSAADIVTLAAYGFRDGLNVLELCASRVRPLRGRTAAIACTEETRRATLRPGGDDCSVATTVKQTRAPRVGCIECSRARALLQLSLLQGRRRCGGAFCRFCPVRILAWKVCCRDGASERRATYA